MGMILKTPRGSKLHAEVRRESFVVYTDHGDQRIEVEYDQLPHLEELCRQIRRQGEKDNGVKAKPPQDELVEALKDEILDLGEKLTEYEESAASVVNDIDTVTDLLARFRTALAPKS
jgi:phage host-nuclease inhibitor protein Gam